MDTRRLENRKVIVERTAEAATAFAAGLFKSIVCETVERGGVSRIALAGGTTPHALYQNLAGTASSDEIPWRMVEVFFGDERDVPQDHVESNYRMAQRTLLDHVPVDPAMIHPMPADAEDLAAAAANYEQTVRRLVSAGTGGVPRFDLILLGMGGDGHTASLFPGTEMLQETKKLVTSGFVPVLGRNRMTFTFPLINAACNVMLLVTGADKAQAVLGIVEDSPEIRSQLPAACVNPVDGTFMIVLDAAAARLTGIAPA
jgi:6-phosphogluconolactonase